MTSNTNLIAPFPWFGGKSKVAPVVWERFGDLKRYHEPFFGSGAMLLGRPSSHVNDVEVVNDLDGFVCNFWRALKADPDQVVEWAGRHRNENEAHARNIWLKQHKGTLSRKLEGDPDFYDARIAGYWVYGICLWIGSNYLGDGPWSVVDGQLLHISNNGQGINRKRLHISNNGQGINRQRLHIADNGRGINRQLLHISNNGRGINRQLLHISNNGQGINRQRLHIADNGQGINRKSLHIADNGQGALLEYMRSLAKRLERVSVCCGDWKRICNSKWITKFGEIGIFLDPPYSDDADRCDDLYTCDNKGLKSEIMEWCNRWGYIDGVKVALCGYEGEYDLPGWECFEWKAAGGYGSASNSRGRDNAHRERIWFSPACMKKAEANDIFEMEML